MISRLVTVVALSLIVAATAVSAGTLWDQSTFDPLGAGYYNSVSGAPPFGSTNYAVCDVTVANTWVIDSITMYFSALDAGWGGAISQGYVNIFPKSGTLPVDGTDDPTIGTLVTMTGTLNVDHFVVTASGLGITLAPGEYWIGITPIAPGGFMGPEICLMDLNPAGDATASYDPNAFPGPAAWMATWPGEDASILITGDQPVPVEESTWGNIKALYK